MKLKNVLLVVDDMEESVRFYQEIFGLQVIMKQESNTILSEGLVLQDVKVWEMILDFLQHHIVIHLNYILRTMMLKDW